MRKPWTRSRSNPLLWMFLWMVASCGTGVPAQSVLEACKDSCGEQGVAEVSIGCNSTCLRNEPDQIE